MVDADNSLNLILTFLEKEAPASRQALSGWLSPV